MLVDSDNIQQIWKMQRGCIKQFLYKMAVDQLATSHYMKRMHFWPSDKCPRCFAPNKTTLHILTRPDPTAKVLFTQQLQKLLDTLGTYQTKPELLHGIQMLYETFHDGLTEIPLQSQPESVITQMNLPLHEFVCCRIVTTWCYEQDKFLQRIQSIEYKTRARERRNERRNGRRNDY